MDMNAYEFHCKANAIKDELARSWDSPKRWALIREYYALIAPILEDGQRFDPYLPGIKMTPIETDVWIEIRCIGLPFYPQYPVGRRFVDFGDPQARIAIEVDGAAFHTPEGDAQKDAELKAEGWRVIRITGKNAYRHSDNLKHIYGLYGRDEEGNAFPRTDDNE